ncbi:PilZ domain-containing protein [Mesorhizobium sp. LHD-90]|uniref:PilZ domain-containing protein n=1 Tax=Mesorhizobium sp. LHD-90 TaxID=3071414 RepID=UPI0027E113E1|nr:PilZ domain-containing protein [Mesorhizobium sp. LHD-90]MDQ6433570.1 PilZ domain-containing protein [Mesorhizobium sp. LHD-90]
MTPIVEKSIGIDGEVFADRRQEDRRRVFKGARLTFNKGYGAFECVVRNVSESGARLVFGDTSAIPSHFDLLMSGEERARKATVRWRSVTALGVSLD